VLLWVYCFAMPCTAQVPKDVYGVPIVGTTTPAEASVMMVHAATSASATLAGSEVGRASHTVLSLGELPAQSALSAKLPPAVPMDVSALDQDEVLEMRLRSMFVTGNLADDEHPTYSDSDSVAESVCEDDSGGSSSKSAASDRDSVSSRGTDELDTTVASGVTLPETFRRDASTPLLSATERLLASMRGRTLANSLSQARMTSTPRVVLPSPAQCVITTASNTMFNCCVLLYGLR
jgi:hypothetical protein